jgi:hypothetical protein
MKRGRRNALLMLVVAILWTAMPAVACSLTPDTMAQPACCTGMPSDCGQVGMASNLCCQVHGNSPVFSPAPLYSSEHLQSSAVVPHQGFLQSPPDIGTATSRLSNTPPPTASPGSISVLRI